MLKLTGLPGQIVAPQQRHQGQERRAGGEFDADDQQRTAAFHVPPRLVQPTSLMAVGVSMKDYGCMLRAYRRPIVQQIVDCDERASFIPALANALANRTE